MKACQISPNLVHLKKTTRFVTKNGKTFENVVPVTIDSLEIGDWPLVQFFSQKYIGQLESIGDRFIANFLRQKLTTKSAINYTHFVYPDIPDVTDFNFDQIIGKIGLPDKGRRGVLKFKVDASKWK
ncbi:hypothetical protein ABEB36_005075 [Hypothenemus hampei]|uniref:Uncharacterized protein n=1 Tax=Hypothenemus hampei TaxID=57062 RepID=A0ABD1EXH6_HYPHA